MTGSNSKGDLIARLVSLGLGLPVFEAQASGPAHDHTFHATVTVDGEVLGTGEGRNRREAERVASLNALRALDETPSRQKGDAPPAPPPAAPHRAPWPIYAEVLAQAIDAALEFAPEDATLADVQQEAAQFYRGLLAELGHDPEAGA